MKRKAILLIILFIIVALSSLIGYGTGFIHGFRNALMFDSPGKGVVDVVELRQLRRGEVDKVIKEIEDDLDWQIYLHGEYSKKGNPYIIRLYFTYFSDPRWKTVNEDYRSMMYTIVKYRTEYPIQMTVPECAQNTNAAMKTEITSNINYKLDLIKKTLGQYGWKETP